MKHHHLSKTVAAEKCSRQGRDGFAGGRTQSIDDIERLMLGVTIKSPLDVLAAAIEANAWLQGKAKSIDSLLKSLAMPWIDHNGEFDLGSMHYSVGYAYSVACRNVPQAADALMDTAGGDFGQFLSALVAQPYKHGTVKTLIGATLYGQLFKVRHAGRLVMASRNARCVTPTPALLADSHPSQFKEGDAMSLAPIHATVELKDELPEPDPVDTWSYDVDVLSGN